MTSDELRLTNDEGNQNSAYLTKNIELSESILRLSPIDILTLNPEP
jgi:hypothetical protein